MAKFYLTSGTVSTVVSAEDAEKAALWVVHKVMQQILPVYQESCSEEKLSHGANALPHPDSGIASVASGEGRTEPSAIRTLGSEILVSEEGPGRDDAGRLDTFELVCHWNQLMVALDRLQALAA